MRKYNLLSILSNPIHNHYLRKLNTSPILRLLFVLGVILFSIISPWLVPQRFQLLFFISILGLLGILILLENLSLGLIVILPISFWIPVNGPGGINGAVIAVAFLSCLWLLNMGIRQHSFQLVPTRVNLPIFVFIVSALLSFGQGQIPWYRFARQAPMDAQIGGFLIFILSVSAFLMVANLIRDIRSLQVITWLFVVFGGLYILDRFIPQATQVLRPLYQRGIISQSIFWVWLVVIPLSQVLFNKHLHTGWRFLLLLLLFATLYTAIVHSSSWKSGYIPPLAGAIVILSLRFRRQIRLLIPVGLLLAWYLSVQAIATDQYSYSTRIEAWQIVLEIAKASPILGMGFANYYWYTPLVPIRGWNVSFNSHNQYVDIIAQTGLFGLICFIWIFLEVGRLSWKLHDRAPEGFARAYVYGVLGGLVGTLVSAIFVDWILPFVYNIGLVGFRSSVIAWMFMGGLVSIEQLIHHKARI